MCVAFPITNLLRWYVGVARPPMLSLLEARAGMAGREQAGKPSVQRTRLAATLEASWAGLGPLAGCRCRRNGCCRPLLGAQLLLEGRVSAPELYEALACRVLEVIVVIVIAKAGRADWGVVWDCAGPPLPRPGGDHHSPPLHLQRRLSQPPKPAAVLPRCGGGAVQRPAGPPGLLLRTATPVGQAIGAAALIPYRGGAGLSLRGVRPPVSPDALLLPAPSGGGLPASQDPNSLSSECRSTRRIRRGGWGLPRGRLP
mmetsp:Transcript_23534/g.65245  ORF Transcript_23534/g.65245 Transcript_23534/m.65245 type:complete len:256 (-) Transcript_23534:1299-2066(-)